MKKNFLIILSLLLVATLFFSACSKNEPSATPTQEELSADANELVEELAIGDYSGAIKNHEYGFVMGLLTGKKSLKVIWESLATQYGEYVGIYEYEYQKQSSFDNIIIKVAFDNQSIDFKVTYDEGTLKISGLHYSINADKPALAGAVAKEPPASVIESNFTLSSGEYDLPAIITLPIGDGPFPLLILVHGSGPNNADESVGAQAPFRDIAWGLAKRGIAVLRYDKRTLVYPNSWDEDSTVVQETIEDVVAAAARALDINEIDTNKIYILGHSLGAMLVPKIAEATPDVNGFIMMASPVTPLHLLMVEQYEYLFNLDGKLTINERISLFKAKRMSKNIDNLTKNSNKKASDLFNINMAYWLYLNRYDVLESTKAIIRPLLVIQGESDYQVPMRDFKALESALEEKPNVSLIFYPELGHLMTKAGDPPSPDDYMQELTVNAQVINDMAKFIKDN